MRRVQLLQTLPRDVSVYLCGRQVTVTKQQLNHPQIRIVIDQMCGKGVPERMWRQVRRNPAALRVGLDTIPE